MDTASPAQRCPRCGEPRPFTRYDVCAPCTAAEGWDPPCPACHAEAADYRVTRADHAPTCAGTNTARGDEETR